MTTLSNSIATRITARTTMTTQMARSDDHNDNKDRLSVNTTKTTDDKSTTTRIIMGTTTTATPTHDDDLGSPA
jgi:hypothetical protein